MISTEEKVKGFAQLPKGWHFGEGGPPNDIIIERAIELIRTAVDEDLITDVFPSTDGDIIQLTVYHGDMYYEFDIGEIFIELIVEEKDKEVDTQRVSLDEAINIIKSIK